MGKTKTPLSTTSSSGKSKKQQLSSLARHGKKLYEHISDNDNDDSSAGSDDDDNVNATGYMSLEKGKKKKSKFSSEEEDDNQEEEVFDLGMSDSDDDDEEDEDEYEEGSEEEDDEASSHDDKDDDDDYYDDDDYANYADDNMKNLLENLPLEARNKILSGKKITQEDYSDDIGEDGDSEDEDEGWGRKKSNYYSGDTADLEIGQDVQDAEDEEEAVKDLHKQTMKKMKDSDFYDNLSSDDDSDDDSDDNDGEVTLKNKMKSGRRKTKGGNDELQSELQTIALSANDASNSVQIEKIERNVADMSRDQKLSMMSADNPELPSLVQELKERVSELKDKIIPIRELVKGFREKKEKYGINDDIIDYLEVKYQMLSAYCLNLCFYLAMRCEGRSVKDHPVMRQLLELRYVMEKLVPIDGKLKHQIDRLVNAANTKDDDSPAIGLRPNPGAFMDDDDEDYSDVVKSEDDQSNDSDESDHPRNKMSKKKNTAPQNEIYRPPKIAAAPYTLEESREEKEARKMQHKRNKLKNSAIYESLQEEFGTAPEQSSSTGIEGMGTADAKALQKEIDERNKFEEERMIRLTMTRKEKQSMKRRQIEANKLDRLTDLGDISGIDEFDDLKMGRKKAAQKASSANAEATAAALKKAVAAFTQSQLSEKAPPSKKRNKNIPDFEMDDIDIDGDGNEFDGIVEDFSKRKKDYETTKAEKYAAEPRYGGLEADELMEGQRRPATYEMIKNRGLTPHRKKANRNPRVKKREAYAKALKNRRGQVRDVITGVGTNYDGELTGIKSSLSKSRKIGN